jgi:hypothetical protein
MKTTLPPSSGPPKHTVKCDRCGRRVIRAVLANGEPLFVQWCEAGRGNVGLVASLFEGSDVLAVPVKGSGYRKHTCPAHSAKALLSESKKLVSTEYFLSDISRGASSKRGG